MSRSVFFPPGGGGGGGITNINVSAGTTSNNLSNLTFANSPTISFGLDGSTITGSAAGGGGLTNIRVSAGTTSNLLSAITFADSNGLAFGLNASTLTGSYTQSNQAFSAAGGSSAFQTLGFSDNAQASFTNNAGQLAITDVRASLFATSNTTQSSSGTQNIDALTFAGAGIASVGITGGSVVVSVPAGGGAGDGGVFAGVSTMGNTAGSTGTVSTGDFVLVGSNQISLSQSTGAAGSAATVTILGPGYLSRWVNADNAVLVAAGDSHVNNSLVSVQPFILPEALVFSNIELAASWSAASAANTSSAYQDVSVSGVFYTRNASTLSSIAGSFSNTFTVSWNSNATTRAGGAQQLTFTIPSTTLTAGDYWVAIWLSTTNTATNTSTATTALSCSVSMILAYSVASAANLLIAPFGSTTLASLGLNHGAGIISTGATMASIGLSSVTVTGTRGRAAVAYFELRNVTWQ